LELGINLRTVESYGASIMGKMTAGILVDQALLSTTLKKVRR